LKVFLSVYITSGMIKMYYSLWGELVCSSRAFTLRHSRLNLVVDCALALLDILTLDAVSIIRSLIISRLSHLSYERDGRQG
jgi:hypothetical protein